MFTFTVVLVTFLPLQQYVHFIATACPIGGDIGGDTDILFGFYECGKTNMYAL